MKETRPREWSPRKYPTKGTFKVGPFRIKAEYVDLVEGPWDIFDVEIKGSQDIFILRTAFVDHMEVRKGLGPLRAAIGALWDLGVAAQAKNVNEYMEYLENFYGLTRSVRVGNIAVLDFIAARKQLKNLSGEISEAVFELEKQLPDGPRDDDFHSDVSQLL